MNWGSRAQQPRSQQELNPYATSGVPAQMSEFAQVLGASEESLEASTAAMKDLCRKLVIRHGKGLASSDLLEALQLPSSETLLKAPLGGHEEAWRELSSRVTLPKSGYLLLDTSAEIHLRSMADLELQKERISFLREQVTACQPIDQSLASVLLDSQADVDTILQDRKRYSDKSEILANLLRQLKLLKEFGSPWTLISSEEREFLEREPQIRKARVPDPKKLREIGLIWRWKEERGSWEPAFPSSKFQNSTLFDFSARYFEKIVESQSASVWSSRQREILKLFLERLGAARKEFELRKPRELESAEKSLRSEQKAALAGLLRAIDSEKS